MHWIILDQNHPTSWSFCTQFLHYKILHFIIVMGRGGVALLYSVFKPSSPVCREHNVKINAMQIQFCGGTIMPVKVEWGKMMSVQNCEGWDDTAIMKLHQNELLSQWKKKEICPKRWWNHNLLWSAQYCWPQTVPSKSSRTLESELWPHTISFEHTNSLRIGWWGSEFPIYAESVCTGGDGPKKDFSVIVKSTENIKSVQQQWCHRASGKGLRIKLPLIKCL